MSKKNLPASFEGHNHSHILTKDLVTVFSTEALELEQAACESRRSLRDQEAQLVLSRLVQICTERHHPDYLPDQTRVHIVHFALLPVVAGPDVALHRGELLVAEDDLPPRGARLLPAPPLLHRALAGAALPLAPTLELLLPLLVRQHPGGFHPCCFAQSRKRFGFKIVKILKKMFSGILLVSAVLAVFSGLQSNFAVSILDAEVGCIVTRLHGSSEECPTGWAHLKAGSSITFRPAVSVYLSTPPRTLRPWGRILNL